jgi:hypothetical protein
MPKLRKQKTGVRIQNITTKNSINLCSHGTPRALPQDNYYVILQGAAISFQ